MGIFDRASKKAPPAPVADNTVSITIKASSPAEAATIAKNLEKLSGHFTPAELERVLGKLSNPVTKAQVKTFL